jgi:uncharacterized protein YjiS (DUF1127 family)
MLENVVPLQRLNLLRCKIDKSFRTAIDGQKPMKDTDIMIAAVIHAYATWRRYRSAVRELSGLDDRALRDIGLNRTQIHRVARYGR